MKQRQKTKKWRTEEVEQIREYAKQNKLELIENLVINIIAGYRKFRKSRNFFNDLSALLERPPSICKSKFQKIEEIVYLEELGISRDVYDTYLSSKRVTKSSVNYDFEQMQLRVFKRGSAQQPESKKIKMNGNFN